MVFSLYCTAELIFLSFVCSILFFFIHCIFVFVLLCFCDLVYALLVILSLLLVIMGSQHDGLFLSGSPPILYIYIHMYIFLMANKLLLLLLYLVPFASYLTLNNTVTLKSNLEVTQGH